MNSRRLMPNMGAFHKVAAANHTSHSDRRGRQFAACAACEWEGQPVLGADLNRPGRSALSASSLLS